MKIINCLLKKDLYKKVKILTWKFIVPIDFIHTQSPILARLVTAFINVRFTAFPLEARQAGTREAIDVVMATAAVETGL